MNHRDFERICCQSHRPRWGWRLLGWLTLFLATFAWGVFVASCASVPIDSRDEMAVVANANECNRRSMSVTLKVVNQSTFSVRIHIVPRSGGRWRLQPTVYGFATERIEVNRHLMDSNGYIILEITGGGLVVAPPRPVPLSPIQCDVGTLFITPSPSMSSYVGADF